MSNKAAIFDMDGTLIDSIKDIGICANKVLEEFSLPTHTLEAYNYFAGGGARVLIDNCTPKDLPEEIILKVLDRFKKIYDNELQGNTTPYAGIIELLTKLKEDDIKLGILSNKPHEFTVKYYEKFFLDFDIKEVHGQKEGIPKKPNPQSAISIAKNLNVPCENSFFVGDTSYDIETAKRAGMVAIGVSWGFRPKEELIEANADFVVDSPIEIYEIIKKLR
eukprot:TRINITY_DN411100_c0_g1_i2.p1 TRINITY_DN411100_c0_g1~~TRINITY_DN411100_c0_g1_i2.p1  ORF type:complete len:220 (-),score=30.07 TRINITY_DN411100_c0_g1_i2:543-1202(-)